MSDPVVPVTPSAPADPRDAATRLRPVDVVRREWYLLRLSWHMQDHPGREEKRIRRELREALTLAAADVGMARAVRDLGHPMVLAESYRADLGRPLPRWTAGAVSAALAAAFLLYLAGAYAVGTLDTLEALGGGTLTTYPLGGETTFTVADDAISVESTLGLPGVLLVLAVAVVAFVLGSRLWRALP